jgi:hypothetical protein
MLNLCGILVAILKMATGRNFSMSGINSGHHILPRYEMSLKYFQNGRHNTAKIQHCSISKVAFDLFTDILSAVGLLSTGNRKHIKKLLIKINNFKFSVRYHSVTELEATLLIKYINYFTICLCYLKLTVYSNFKRFGRLHNR